MPSRSHMNKRELIADLDALDFLLAEADKRLSGFNMVYESLCEAERKLKGLPADWYKDSSLETWFPLTAEELRKIKPVCAEIHRIMETYREQEDAGNVDSPGGLEHMGDVWNLLSKWDKMLFPSGKETGKK
jgi:hypothetical protein